MKLTWLAAAWLAGLALAYHWYDSNPTPLLLLAAFALTVFFLCRLLNVAGWPALLAAVCLLGIWRYEFSEAGPPLQFIEYAGTTQVRGIITGDPETTSTRIKFTLRSTAIKRPKTGAGGDWEPYTAGLLVYSHPPLGPEAERDLPYLRYGEYVELLGTQQRPEPIERFDYPSYLESQGIHGIFWSQETRLIPETSPKDGPISSVGVAGSQLRLAVYDLRRHMARTLELSLPPSQAYLAQALLLGLRGQLADEVTDNFRRSGTAHLLAISGLHLGILLLMSVGALHWLLGHRTPVPLLLALALVWLYVLLSGAPASVVRAAIMGSVYLAALGLGRPRESLLPALALSAVAMTMLEPGVVGLVSFQLSFAAMAGIALALPWLDSVGQGIRNRLTIRYGTLGTRAGSILAWLSAGVIVSAAATVATFPLVALNFGVVPLLGIPATIVATPILPFALAGGLVAVAAGTIHPVLGQLAGFPASFPLTALLQLVELTPKWTAPVPLEGWNLAWAWYAAVIMLLVAADTRYYRGRMLQVLNRISGAAGGPGQQAGSALRSGKFFAFSGLGLIVIAAAAFFLGSLAEGSDGLLHVHFLDVGQGDSIFIVTPQGRQVLVDGGPEHGGAAEALSRRMAPWDRSLDLVAATHLDTDHSRGLLRVLRQYRIGTVAEGQPDPKSSLYPQWGKALADGKHSPAHLSAGDRLDLEEGIFLEALHPPGAALRGPAWDSNNNSLVLKLVYGDLSFLLTGDIEEEAERYLARNAPALQSSVLKAGHHGSNSSSTAAFLKAVNPRWAVISAGTDNQYGHPHPDVVDRLGQAVGKENVFSTAVHGTIHFSTDGQRLWVETER